MQERRDTAAAALWRASYTGDLETVRHLAAEGVDLNVWDRYGRNALTLAAGAGHLAVVRFLISSGAWIDPFEDGCIYKTPLMAASAGGHLEIVEFLLDRGANPIVYGGVGYVTAAVYAKGHYLKAILRLAEDNWRRRHADVPWT